MLTKPEQIKNTEIIAIAAINNNRVIADNGEIPWDIEEDKKHYIETVSDSPVLIGRKTFEDAPPLPGINIVLTKTGIEKQTRENVYEANSLQEAFDLIDRLDIDQIYNVGGAEIYSLVMDYTDKLILSHIPNNKQGDTHFPQFDNDNWVTTHIDERTQFTIKTYQRR